MKHAQGVDQTTIAVRLTLSSSNLDVVSAATRTFTHAEQSHDEAHMMKQRITYFRQHDAPFDLSQLSVEPNGMQIDDLEAAKEHRITIGLSELPGEVSIHMEPWPQDRGY